MPSRTAVATAHIDSFVHEPQSHPLNARAISDLENLKRTHANRQLSTTKDLEACLEKAAQFLIETVAPVNDRGTEAQVRWKNRRERNEEETEEQKAEYEDVQRKVKELTSKMDEGVRRVIDDGKWREGIVENLDHVIGRSKEVTVRKERMEEEAAEDQDESEDEDSEGEGRRPSNRSQPFVFQAGESAGSLLQAADSTAATQWNAMSLTERYANDDTYVNFFKLKWDSQHPGDNAPIMPPNAMFFAEQEGRSQRANRSQPATQNSLPGGFVQSDDEMEDPDESEIQVFSENRSCKCPITLQYFKSPVTSKKCPHSFEKSAILDVIRQQRGVMQCPETGCKEMLRAEDLSDDALLKRKTQRAVAAEQAEQEAEESDEDSDDDMIGTQRKKKKAVRVGSSPAPENRRRTLIKDERDRDRERNVSVVPDSQPTRNMRNDVMDVDEDDEEDDDE